LAKLIVDFGNTFLKLGVFEVDELQEVQKLEVSNWNGEALEPILGKLKNSYGPFSASIISTVIDLEEEDLELFKISGKFLFLSQETKVNFKNKYHSPNSLGTDRIAAVAGVSYLFPQQNSLVIHAGTCLTYDFLNRDNEYLGGIISPGLKMRSQALNTFTNKLPLLRVNTIMAYPYLGRNTQECIISGISWGIIHEVQGFLHQFSADYSKLNVILAGGDSKFLDTHLKNTIFAHQIKWIPDLVLIGLNRILTIQNA
jgi:type III pantothenate kinase